MEGLLEYDLLIRPGLGIRGWWREILRRVTHGGSCLQTACAKLHRQKSEMDQQQTSLEYP